MAGSLKKQNISDNLDYWPECDLCPKLCKNTMNVCLEGEGPENADLMLVGEAPGETEDDLNRPFVGQVGEYLRDDILVPARIPESKIRFTNSSRCHPPKNRTPTVTEIKKCRRYLEAEIKKINPKVIVALGNAPLASLLQFFYRGKSEEGTAKKQEGKVSGITMWQGKMVWLQEFQCWLMPTFHPSYCMRNERSHSIYSTNLVIDDLRKAWDYAQKERPEYSMPRSIYVTEVTRASAVINKMWESKEFAFDIETGGKGRAIDKRIIGCSFAHSPNVGYYIPWEVLLRNKAIFKRFKTLITSRSHYKIMHNGAYETRIFEFVENISINGVKYFDTMIAAHLVNENFSKRLKDLAWIFTNFGGYDIPLEKYKAENKIKEDYSAIPVELLAPYGALDSIATWILYMKLKPAMVEEKVISLFDKIVMPVRRVMSDAEINGMHVDKEQAEKLWDLGNTAIKKLETEIYRCAGQEFNIASPIQLQKVLYNTMGFMPLKKIKTGFSADVESIEHISMQPNSEIAEFLLDRSYVNTMLSTHVGQALAYRWEEDGRVHTNYNVTGTVTGRASCLARGTLVPTARGIIPIEEVVKGDYVISHTGIPRKVLKRLYQGIKPTYQLTTMTDRSILCTIDHRFYTANGWQEAKDVKELYYVNIEDVYERFELFRERAERVHRESRETFNRPYRQDVRYNKTECLRGFAESINKGTIPGRKSDKVISIKDERKESNEGNDGQETSQLEGSTFRQSRSSCVSSGWKDVFLSSGNTGQVVKHASERFGKQSNSAPYRQRPIEQSNRQFGVVYKSRTSETTPQVESVKIFTFVGEIQVFDLVIEVDESFIANGFLAHNCSRPSLQNVPKDAFVRSLYAASPGNMLVEADLKSAEIAVVAAVSGEETFITAFREGLDIHSETYKKIYDLPSEYVCTQLERRYAKAINFGLIYGLTAIGLARRLRITIEEATEFVNLYFQQFPNIEYWMRKQGALVKRDGYVVSVFGRKRRLAYGLSDMWGDIGRAERQAMNSPVQSGASDYTYIGLIRLRRAIIQNHLEGKIVHTVHDCGLADTPKIEVPTMVELFKGAFETPVRAMPIKMQVEVEVNKRWGQNNESRLQEIFDKVGLKLAL